jgi:hypothetical protein
MAGLDVKICCMYLQTISFVTIMKPLVPLQLTLGVPAPCCSSAAAYSPHMGWDTWALNVPAGSHPHTHSSTHGTHIAQYRLQFFDTASVL